MNPPAALAAAALIGICLGFRAEGRWFAARWLKARLTTGEITWIGFSGLLVVVGPAALANAAHPWVFMIARGLP